MIQSAEEFAKLRQSEISEEQFRASHDPAEISVWIEVIEKFPELKIWVIHNKTIQIEILEMLGKDPDSNIRSSVARKRKINTDIFNLLSIDKDENVRFALISNASLTADQLKQIKVDDSHWLAQSVKERLLKIIQ
jgi:hypothetical protein